MNGLFRLARVAWAAAGDSEDLEEELMETLARQDDAFWARYARGPYSPQRFINWWIARRWVVPRDVRRS